MCFNLKDILSQSLDEYAKRISEEVEKMTEDVPTLRRDVPSQIAHEKALSHNKTLSDVLSLLNNMIKK